MALQHIFKSVQVYLFTLLRILQKLLTSHSSRGLLPCTTQVRFNISKAMKIRSIFFASLSATVLAHTVELPRSNDLIQPGDKITPGKFHDQPRYLTWMADSQIKRGVAPTNAYTTSAVYSGILLAYNRTGNRKYLDYVHHQIDILLYPEWNGNIVLYNGSSVSKAWCPVT